MSIPSLEDDLRSVFGAVPVRQSLATKQIDAVCLSPASDGKTRVIALPALKIPACSFSFPVRVEANTEAIERRVRDYFSKHKYSTRGLGSGVSVWQGPLKDYVQAAYHLSNQTLAGSVREIKP